MTGLPVDVGICTVTGTLKSGEQIEGSDAAPDLASLAGYVKFNPSTTRTVHYGDELIIHLKPIIAEVDENGYFETQLIATDDTDLNPHGWTYTVSFHLVGAKFPTFAIDAPQGTTVDLSSVVPVAVANGTTIIQGGPVGPNGDSAYEVAVAGGFVGDEAAWLASLEGPEGNPGPSAYEVAVAEGFVGDEAAWLASLGGIPGESAYEVAVSNGFVGDEAAWLASLVGPGTTDHGELSGLGDDDHTQYHNDTRGDIRYYTKSAANALFMTQTAAAAAHADFISGDGSITDIVTMTQAAYDALGSYDANTLYVIVG